MVLLNSSEHEYRQFKNIEEVKLYMCDTLERPIQRHRFSNAFSSFLVRYMLCFRALEHSLFLNLT